jgi:acyl carrier protein
MSDTEELREQLLDIIATEGMVDRAKLTPDATIETIGMASYDMVMILMAIEEKYGVYLSVDSELTDVKTLDQLLTILAERVKQGGNAPAPEGGAADGGGAADLSAAAAAAATIGTPAAAPAPVASPSPLTEEEKTKAGAS